MVTWLPVPTASNRLFKSRILISVIGEWGSVTQFYNGLRICRSILSPTRSSSRPPQTSRFPRMDSSPNRSEASTLLPMLFIQQKWSTSQPYLVRAKVILYPYFGTEVVQPRLIPPPPYSAATILFRHHSIPPFFWICLYFFRMNHSPCSSNLSGSTY